MMNGECYAAIVPRHAQVLVWLGLYFHQWFLLSLVAVGRLCRFLADFDFLRREKQGEHERTTTNRSSGNEVVVPLAVPYLSHLMYKLYNISYNSS